MRKTFCDRCGERCVNSTVLLRVEVQHHTANMEYVGEDEFKPAEICKTCWDEVAEVLLPLVLDIRSKITDIDSEAQVMESPLPHRHPPLVHANEEAGSAIHARAMTEVPHD